MALSKTLSSLKKVAMYSIVLGGLSTSLYAGKSEEDKINLWSSPKIAPQKFNGDLRSLPTADGWLPGQMIKNMPRKRFNPDYVKPGQPKHPVTQKNDPLMAKQSAVSTKALTSIQSIEQGFDGEGFSGVNPPDPTGDVGLNYYIQSINGSGGSIFSIYDKNTGNKVAGPLAMDNLGSGNCGSGAGDPIILFDEMAQRWFLSEFSRSGNYLCVYVSQTSDPVSGGWFNYAFQSPTFPDYPKYGVWNDAYYVGTNERSPTVYALNRGAMLTGDSANFIRITAPEISGFGFQMMTPLDHDGVTAPTNGTPGLFLRHRDDEVHNSNNNNPNQDFLELWQFVVDFANTNNSSFTKVSDIAISEIDSSLCGLTSFSCFPQAGSNTRLDPLREVVMYRAQYRNFGSYETIVGNLVTDVNGNDRGGVRWFELRRTGGNSGAWTLHQEGTYSPDNKNRWMGSIAMDKDGNIALAYSWGSSSDFAGIRYTGRSANGVLGTMDQAEAVLVNGTSRVSSNRFGDYAHMALDPVDGCTYWFTGEYGKSNGQWGTYISSFKFDSCGGDNGNLPPAAAFSESCSELSCSFDGSASSDSDGSIQSYSWDFGDGTTASGANASRNYNASGTYSVSLTVEDDRGARDTVSRQVTVVDPTNEAPTASFTANCSDLTCDFNASSSSDSDGSVDNYAWDFGDGTTGSGVATSRTFASEGMYKVTLTVTDDDGATGEALQDVSVTEPVTNITIELEGSGGFFTFARVFWDGANGNQVDIYRDGSRIATTANDGNYFNFIGFFSGGTYTYQVCEAGSSACSPEAQVTL